MDEVDHILVYLMRHRTVGITYSPVLDEFRGMSDASWEVRNSTSGRVLLWCQTVTISSHDCKFYNIVVVLHD